MDADASEKKPGSSTKGQQQQQRQQHGGGGGGAASAAAGRHRTLNTDEQPGLEVYHPPSKSSAAGSAAAAPSSRRDRAAAAAPEIYFSDGASTVNASPSAFTFYREGTPPPPEDPLHEHDKEALSAGPRSPGGAETESGLSSLDRERARRDVICGLRRRVFWLVLGAVILVVVIAIAVGVGAGVSAGKKSSSEASSGATATSPSAPAITSGSSAAPPPHPATTGPSTTPTTPTTTSTSSSSASPTATWLTDCPAANGTVYHVPGSDKSFLRVCGVDYSGFGEAVDLSHLPTGSMAECMDNCAGTIACTGCAWGFVQGDTGTDYQCWMKSTLGSSHAAAPDWCFAILQ